MDEICKLVHSLKCGWASVRVCSNETDGQQGSGVRKRERVTEFISTAFQPIFPDNVTALGFQLRMWFVCVHLYA